MIRRARSRTSRAVVLTLAVGVLILPTSTAGADTRDALTARSDTTGGSISPANEGRVHRLYLAPLSASGYPAVSAASARDAALAAGQYWVEALRGQISRFEHARTTAAVVNSPCGLVGPGGTPASAFSELERLFSGVSPSAVGNHLLGFVPPSCGQDGARRSQSSMGTYKGGLSLLGGTNHHALVGALGDGLGAERAGSAVPNGFALSYPDVPNYGPMTTVVPGYAPGALDAFNLDWLGALPASQVVRGAQGSVTLRPVHSTTGVIAATFTDPYLGRTIYLEYRDGTGPDAGTYYALDGHDPAKDAKVSDQQLQSCRSTHGAKSPKCDTRHIARPGVRVVEVQERELAGERWRYVYNLGLPVGFGSRGALVAGDSLLGPGGKYRVTVQSIADGEAKVAILLGDAAGVEPAPPTPEPEPEPEPEPGPEPEPEPGPEPEPEPEPEPTPEVGVPAGPYRSEVTAGSARTTWGDPATLDIAVTVDHPRHAVRFAYGQVDVLAGSESLTSTTVEDGVARVELPASLAVGRHELSLRFGGNANTESSQGTVVVDVDKALPTLSAKVSKATYGSRAAVSVRLDAGVDAEVDGIVDLRVDGKKVATATLQGGKATATLSKKLPVGKHELRVEYRGSPRFVKLASQHSLRVHGTKARVKGFASGTKKVAARTTYRDKVALNAKGVLQRKTAKGWTKVRSVPKGSSTVKIRAGKAGSRARYRIVIKDKGSLQGFVSRTLRLRSR